MRPRFEPLTDFDEWITEKSRDLTALFDEHGKAVAEIKAKRPNRSMPNFESSPTDDLHLVLLMKDIHKTLSHN